MISHLDKEYIEELNKKCPAGRELIQELGILNPDEKFAFRDWDELPSGREFLLSILSNKKNIYRYEVESISDFESMLQTDYSLQNKLEQAYNCFVSIPVKYGIYDGYFIVEEMISKFLEEDADFFHCQHNRKNKIVLLVQ